MNDGEQVTFSGDAKEIGNHNYAASVGIMKMQPSAFHALWPGYRV